jgi:hypothetical protein
MPSSGYVQVQVAKKEQKRRSSGTKPAASWVWYALYHMAETIHAPR